MDNRPFRPLRWPSTRGGSIAGAEEEIDECDCELGSALLGLMLIVAACGGEATPSGGGGGGDGELVFWTVEDNVDRVAGQQAIIDRFTEETGIAVELVAIGEADLTTQITAAVAGDTLPDVFGALSLGFTHTLAADGLANADAHAAVVDALGRDTFAQSALDLVTTDDGLAGVPSDSWAQLLVYRKDLFEAAGLEPPTTYDTILAAAEELNTGDQAGIVLATGNDLTFVQQTFEYFAVANGCDVARRRRQRRPSPRRSASRRSTSTPTS